MVKGAVEYFRRTDTVLKRHLALPIIISLGRVDTSKTPKVAMRDAYAL